MRHKHLAKALTARALLAGPDCSQQRVSDLLGGSRRTISLMAEADLCDRAARPARARAGADVSEGNRQPRQHGRGTGRGGRLAQGRRRRTPGRAGAVKGGASMPPCPSDWWRAAACPCAGERPRVRSRLSPHPHRPRRQRAVSLIPPSFSARRHVAWPGPREVYRCGASRPNILQAV